MNSTAGRVAEGSPQSLARWAGFFWLMTIVTGASALMFADGRLFANLAATACYLAATLLVNALMKRVNRIVSYFAVFSSLVGCVIGTLSAFQLSPVHVNPLVFFGLHCLLVGYLIVRSTFLPRILGVLLAFGGVGWLTFALPSLAKQLSPWNMAPGILGEAALSLWLLIVGVNVPRWKAG